MKNWCSSTVNAQMAMPLRSLAYVKLGPRIVPMRSSSDTQLIARPNQGFDITHGRYDNPCHQPPAAVVVRSEREIESALMRFRPLIRVMLLRANRTARRTSCRVCRMCFVQRCHGMILT